MPTPQLGKYLDPEGVLRNALGVTGVDAQGNAAQLPISQPDIVASGNITVLNSAPAGVATAGSAVSVAVNGNSSLSIQVTGTWTGGLSLQATVDGVNWVTFGGQPVINLATATGQANITGNGIYQADIAGFTTVRVTELAAHTGTAVISLHSTAGDSMLALDGALPTGANNIGNVVLAPSVTAGGFPTAHTLISAATTNATLIRAGATTIQTLILSNTTAAPKYVKIKNQVTVFVPGTTVPDLNIAIPANATIVLEFAQGYRLPLGFTYAITGASPALDTTVTAIGDVLLNAVLI